MLKNYEEIKSNDEAKAKLESALEMNKSLAMAYYLKEELKLLWRQNNVEECKAFLGQWVAKAIASGVKELQKFAVSLLAHRSGIFNWYEFRISSGPLEGFNNKIKVMKRVAYGYRDNTFFKLKIYALHKTKYALVG